MHAWTQIFNSHMLNEILMNMDFQRLHANLIIKMNKVVDRFLHFYIMVGHLIVCQLLKLVLTYDYGSLSFHYDVIFKSFIT